jgi:hypothetical protein
MSCNPLVHLHYPFICLKFQMGHTRGTSDILDPVLETFCAPIQLLPILLEKVKQYLSLLMAPS